MSFAERHDVVQNGDTVILFLGHNSMQSVKINSGKVHQAKYGAFPHENFIGREFGSKVYSSNRKGWVQLLHPSPELWTVTLPHRTQILYTTDISLISFELELRPGSVVIESGTGSGSASHAFIRTIMPYGHLYTFDFHKERAEQARLEFEDHHLGKFVTSTCRDVLSEGFGLKNVADAVFLDLPKPWVAIQSAKEAIKESGGRLCSFSPCIEQVHRTSEQLRKLGFCEIKTVECLCKSYDVRTIAFPEAQFSEHDIHSVEHKKEETTGSTVEMSTKMESSHPSNSEVEERSASNSGDDLSKKTSSSLKRRYSETPLDMKMPHCKIQKPGKRNVLTARPIKEIPGHTGYLTFATLLPMFESS